MFLRWFGLLLTIFILAALLFWQNITTTDDHVTASDLQSLCLQLTRMAQETPHQTTIHCDYDRATP